MNRHRIMVVYLISKDYQVKECQMGILQEFFEDGFTILDTNHDVTQFSGTDYEIYAVEEDPPSYKIGEYLTADQMVYLESQDEYQDLKIAWEENETKNNPLLQRIHSLEVENGRLERTNMDTMTAIAELYEMLFEGF